MLRPAASRGCAVTTAPTIAASLGSVKVPLIEAVCCAGVEVSRKNKHPNQLATARTKKRSSLIFPPLPLARELKVVLVTMRLAPVVFPASRPGQKDREFCATQVCQD